MANKFFGIDPDKRDIVPDSFRKTGVVADSSGNKGLYDKYFNQLLFELKANHIWGTSTQVKATEPEATFYVDGSGNPLDKDDVAVQFFDDDIIEVVYDTALSGTLNLNCSNKRLQIKTGQETPIDLNGNNINFSNAALLNVVINSTLGTEGPSVLTGAIGIIKVNGVVKTTNGVNISYSLPVLSLTDTAAFSSEKEGASLDFEGLDGVGGNRVFSQIKGIAPPSGVNDAGQLGLFTRKAGVLTEKVRIDEEGNVGIGTDTPLKDFVVQSTTAPTIQIQDNAGRNLIFVGPSNTTDAFIGTDAVRELNLGTNNTDAITIDGSQKVGFGTASPSGKFHVNGGTVVFGDQGWPTSTIGQSDNRFLITDDTSVFLILNNANNAVAANNSSFLRLGARATTGANDMAYSTVAGGKENSTDGDKRSFLSLSTTISNGQSIEAARIDSSQNFGIGTTTPSTELDVNGTINATGITGSLLDLILPIGSVKAYAGTKARNSVGTLITLGTGTIELIDGIYMVCNGQGISTTTYAELFNRLGYEHGGSGATFNVPNYQGDFLRGYGGSAETNLGDTQNHQLQGHHHGSSSSTGTLGPPYDTPFLGTGTGGSQDYWAQGATSDGVNTPLNIGSETRPVNQTVFYLIRVI